jgi:hypothetical protein
MIKEKTKAFEFQGRRWQVEKATALDGANIIRKLVSSGAKGAQDFLSKLSNDEFQAIQNILLSKVFEVQNINGQETTLPIITPSGALSNSISEDATLVYMLTVISLSFDMQSFFDESALKEFTETMSIFNA